MKSLSLIVALTVVAGLFSLTGGEACGQSSFSLAVGSGGGGHHHGHHHHGHHHHRSSGWSFGYSTGPWYSPAWYAPPAVIYAPPPVVQERVIYVQPTTPTYAAPPAYAAPAPSPYTSSTQRPNNSVAADSPPVISSAAVTDDRIVIRNAAGAQLPVAFVVDGQDVELQEGGVRTFVGKAQRTVQYDRGGKFGSTQQDVTGGQYEFRVTASGWDLVRRPDVTPSRTAVRTNSLPETR